LHCSLQMHLKEDGYIVSIVCCFLFPTVYYFNIYLFTHCYVDFVNPTKRIVELFYFLSRVYILVKTGWRRDQGLTPVMISQNCVSNFVTNCILNKTKRNWDRGFYKPIHPAAWRDRPYLQRLILHRLGIFFFPNRIPLIRALFAYSLNTETCVHQYCSEMNRGLIPVLYALFRHLIFNFAFQTLWQSWHCRFFIWHEIFVYEMYRCWLRVGNPHYTSITRLPTSDPQWI